MRTVKVLFKGTFVLIGILSLLTAVESCGKKKSSSSSSVKLQTIIDSKNVAGSIASVTYSANIDEAEFQCKTDVDAQAGQWQTCGSEGITFPVKGGSQYAFQVKALDENGNEDKTPATWSFVQPVDTNTGTNIIQGNEPNLITVIKNKSVVAQTYRQKSLKLEFEIQGASVNPQDIRFECKVGNETEFKRCQDSTSANNAYEFAELQDGLTYKLTVRSVYVPKNTTGSEDFVSFTVSLDKLTVDGADTLEKSSSRGKFNLNYQGSIESGNTLSCMIDQSTTDCSNGSFVVDTRSLTQGSHRVTMTMLSNNVEVSSRIINFCVECGSSANVPVVQDFGLGSFFNFHLNEGMHLIEHASTKTYNGFLSFYRISPEDDPYYVGNWRCDGQFDSITMLKSPGYENSDGNVYKYCHITPPRDYYKESTDYMLANNHIEVASDPEMIQAGQHTRMLVQVYDQDWEYMNSRSRFLNHCENFHITKYGNVPLFNDFFWNTEVGGDMYVCEATLQGMYGAAEYWRVAGIFLAEGGNLPNWDDAPTTPCNFKYQKAVEIVYMEQANGGGFNAQFAKRVQEAVKKSLTKTSYQ